MAHAVTSRLIGDLTSCDVPRLIGARAILCLPIGSIEQHGPHLPLNTDVVLAEEITRRIVARWGESLDLWQLPTWSVSLAREHAWAPGTLSLSVAGMTSLMRDLGREIARALPTRNLAIVNGHGGNRGILEALAQDLRADNGLNVCVLHPAAWADADARVPEIHGGRNETSLMLAVAPHLVRQDRIAQLRKPLDADTIGRTILDPAVTWPWTSDDPRLADTGVIGDPQGASAELGRRMLDDAVERAGAVLKQLRDRRSPASG